MKFAHVLSASVAVVLSLAVASAPKAFAASPATATIAVSATVTNSCTVNNGTLPFGTYTGTKLSVTGTFTVNCTTGGDYIIALNAGIGSGASFTNRLMTNGGTGLGSYTLGYNIYTVSGGGVVWGDGTGSTQTVTGTGTGAAQTINVYGVIPAGEAAISGTYNDTVTATVTY